MPQGFSIVRIATEQRVWKALTAAHALMAAGMAEDLRSASGLSLTEHQLLAELATRPDGAIRLNELADLLLLTPSGISRLVDRLEAERLVERVTCPLDRRGFHARLTEEGRGRLEAAQERHSQALQRLLGELPRDLLERLAESLERVSARECGAALKPS